MSNPKTPNLGLDLIDRTSPTTTYLNLDTNLDQNWLKIDAGVLMKSTFEVTLYVDAVNGSDTNDGLSAATALKTVQAAVDKVPNWLEHKYTINVAPGTYNEDVLVAGKEGDNFLDIVGDSVASTSRTVNSILIRNCGSVVVTGFNLVSTTKHGIEVLRTRYAQLQYNRIVADGIASVVFGIHAHSSYCLANNNEISNRYHGILSNHGSRVTSNTNTGRGNTFGLNATYASSIGKIGIQPAGNTMELMSAGGIISQAGIAATTANMTLYVDAANGDDANDGLAAGAGRALKTIAAAIARVPQVVNHTVTINVASGTYSETVSITGISGRGKIQLIGNTVAYDVIVTAINIASCSLYITAQGFKCTSTINHNVNISFCNAVYLSRIQGIDAQTSAGVAGIYADYSTIHVYSSELSNKDYGILALRSTVYSQSNAGTGNAQGLSSQNGATIAKGGTQPAGTTAEYVANGGAIR
ncbi:hypothetical protein [Paenibacillus naphthalenovorans]|uniref:hypothetical protein n=1 Tax=Paenibacillus naphthalenovorans TaxID=162209 RepID=UPI003D2AD723